MDEREREHGFVAPHHSPDAYYRIGSQVHDHETRIRLLERESVLLSESVRQIRSALEDIGDTLDKSQASVEHKLDDIDARLVAHVVEETGSVRRLFSSSILQFLVVVSGLLYLILEGRL